VEKYGGESIAWDKHAKKGILFQSTMRYLKPGRSLRKKIHLVLGILFIVLATSCCENK